MYCVWKARMLVHKSPISWSDDCASKKNRHIKAFVADFGNQYKSDSETEADDAIDDFVAHVLDIILVTFWQIVQSYTHSHT